MYMWYNNDDFDSNNFDRKLKTDKYNEYVNAQITRNGKRNKGRPMFSWIDDNQLKVLAEIIINHSEAKNGICHGAANGWEVKKLKEFIPNINIIGTDLAGTGEILKWDFHKVKEEWINNRDFIYSNALDHSYNPFYCIDQWMSCVKKSGLCILSHASGHYELCGSNNHDCFGASVEEYKENIEKKYKFSIHDCNFLTGKNLRHQFLLIQHGD